MPRPRCRVAVTGGPGGGKSTAVDLFRRELGEEVVVVPESATMLFSGGFPRTEEPEARCYAQRAIFHVQRNLEDLYRSKYPGRALICDRGTVDGAAYWPRDGDYFMAMGTTHEAELARYDAVIFFESAAVGGMSIEGGNPTRIESDLQAVQLDRALRELWKDHAHFVMVPHQASFFEKLRVGFEAMREIVRAHRANGGGG
ncbi:MAG: ATP-binding protein [Sandaracinaceae bacterium]|nr:ATP-binding protein [Sandaracinaceae bacterium]